MKKFNKENQLLEFIKEYIDDNGFPPTIREMCKAVNVSSTSTISYYLNKLETDGIIKKNPNRSEDEDIGEIDEYN